MQSSLPTTTATRPMHRDLVASQNVMSGRLYVVGSQQQRRDVMRHNAHMGSSASWYALYQRLLRYVRRLLTRRREIEFDEMDFNPPRYRPDRINALCRLTNFSRNEIKLMYQGFKQVCPTGIVNENTFKDIFSSYFPQGDATQYAHYVFKACDQEKNGTLNFQEFVQGLSMLTRGSTEQKLRWTFNLYDIDGDGRITRNEMREIISSVYQMLGRYTTPLVEDNTAQQHADKVFQKLDQNQDGYVTFEEFLETCQKDENIISSLQLLDTVL